MAHRRVPGGAPASTLFSCGRKPRCGMPEHRNDGAPVALIFSLTPFAASPQSIPSPSPDRDRPVQILVRRRTIVFSTRAIRAGASRDLTPRGWRGAGLE